MELLHINLWWMALFILDFTEAILCAASTLVLMPPKYLLTKSWQKLGRSEATGLCSVETYT